MEKFNQAEYNKQYQRDNLRCFKLRLHREHDAVMIKHLERQKNKQGYIKELIRKDMRDS